MCAKGVTDQSSGQVEAVEFDCEVVTVSLNIYGERLDRLGAENVSAAHFPVLELDHTKAISRLANELLIIIQ